MKESESVLITFKLIFRKNKKYSELINSQKITAIFPLAFVVVNY